MMMITAELKAIIMEGTVEGPSLSMKRRARMMRERIWKRDTVEGRGSSEGQTHDLSDEQKDRENGKLHVDVSSFDDILTGFSWE